VRKKAKYLHDAPAEALGPVLGPGYNPNGGPNRQNGNRQNSAQSDTSMSTPGRAFLPAANNASYPVYSGTPNQPGVGMEGLTFNPPTATTSPPFQTGGNAQMGGMMGANNMDFNALFDPSNPALYNFDLEGLNFGSQYAGWEFGILNKMGLGADSNSRDNSISHSTDPGYAALFGNGNNTPMMGDFSGLEPSSTTYTQGNLQHGLPHAYAIAAAPTSLASPSTDATTSPAANTENSPKSSSFAGLAGIPGGGRMKTKPDKVAQILGKRQRDSASIYAAVKEPYPYTTGFHNMISVLRDRLPLNKLLKIARSLGEIRPSFIACTKDLTREDLVFMEKCFQRTLVEFNDFLHHCCAPTIVCRRSGEIAAVNKEFVALTGWTKEVLLGKEANQNVYSRPLSNDASEDTDGARSGTITPHARSTMVGSGGNELPQPVFLAELLDDDSVVDFYHDFSQLAFEDSRGKVQRSCRLLKYRTAEDHGIKDLSSKAARTGILSNRVTRIDGEHGISRIEKNGKVDCTYSWTIKRDVFDIPMMIIMNVSFFLNAAMARVQKKKKT
jgi:PAS domain S-box-containing protein